MRDTELWWLNQESEQLKKHRMKIYNSKRWKATRAHVLATNPFCVICQENGKLTPAVDVDHIKPLSAIILEGLDSELAYDLENLRGLCKRCHGQKSITEGARKSKNNNKLRPK